MPEAMGVLFGSVAPTESAGQLALLKGHFFGRFFYNDLISSSEDPQLSAANLMAVLAFPGMLSLYLLPKYYVYLARAPEHVRHLSVVGDRWIWIGFSMIVLALLTLVEWDSLFPDSRDWLILGSLPLRPATIFAAQAWALVRFLLLFFLIMNAAALFFFPLAAVDPDAAIVEGLRFFFSHAGGVFAANVFIVTSLIALQGLLLSALGPAWFRRVAPLCQFLLIVVLLACLVLLPGLARWALGASNQHGSVYAEDPLVFSMPPMWFVGLAEALNGAGNPVFHSLARAAVIATAISLLLACLSYLWTYQRFVRRSMESQGSADGPWPLLRIRLDRMVRWLRLDSEGAVAFRFALWTVFRSRYHRVRLGAFAALGFALVVARLLSAHGGPGPGSSPDPLLLSLAYIPAFLLLVGLRSVFSKPAELKANWIFRLTCNRPLVSYLPGSKQVLLLVVGFPLGLVTALAWGWMWGWVTAIGHLMLFVLVVGISAELTLIRFPKIPFTCTFVPPRVSGILLWAAGAVGLFLYSSTLGSLESWAFANLLHFLAVGIGAAGLWALLSAFADLGLGTEPPLFHESSDPVVQRLHLEP